MAATATPATLAGGGSVVAWSAWRRQHCSAAGGPAQQQRRRSVAAAATGPAPAAAAPFTSLIPETLEDLESDGELLELHARVQKEGQVRAGAGWLLAGRVIQL
jgi:hypothetical protein